MSAAHELKDKLLQVLLAHSYNLLTTNNSGSSIDQVSLNVNFTFFSLFFSSHFHIILIQSEFLQQQKKLIKENNPSPEFKLKKILCTENNVEQRSHHLFLLIISRLF